MILLVLTGVIALAAAVVFLPAPLAWLDGTKPTVAAVQANRQALLWMAGGLIAVVTLLLAGFRDRTSRQKLELDRDANRTTRYTEAVTQLGTTGSVAIRLGGAYALERIAQDSDRDRPVVLNVLMAYLRHDGLTRERPRDERQQFGYWEHERPEDVSAVLTIVTRLLGMIPDRELLQFDRADLRHADFFLMDLTEASFVDADLYDANLVGTTLLNANFSGATLWTAKLADADVRGAKFRRANLTGVDLSGADVAGADFYEANLEWANLSHVQGLDQADHLESVQFNSLTIWPEGFVPHGQPDPSV